MNKRTARPCLWLGILILTLLGLLTVRAPDRAVLQPPSLDPFHPALNASKLALLIENRPSALLAPLMLHFIATLPPDWTFRFLGSAPSLAAINASRAIRAHAAAGKLALARIPPNMSTSGPEMISRFLTTLWVYESLLRPAEHLLLFQTDSVLCANSPLAVDDFLAYDWVGAPWNPAGDWGGNGGLSLRRVSRIVDVLRSQVRPRDADPEDVWLSERVAAHPLARVANGSVSLRFSGELHPGEPVRVGAAPTSTYVRGLDDWRNGFYEPMGYHTGGSGAFLHGAIWGDPRRREHIWKYCPEIKMTLAMDLARYVPGHCGAVWTETEPEM